MKRWEQKTVSRRSFLKTSSKIGLGLAAGCAISGGLPGCSGSDDDFDVLIKNGTIYDGALSKPFTGDIGIKGDRIAAVGKLIARAETTIDAVGCIVAPGFIDVHTHSDLTFKKTGLKRYLSHVMPSWKGNYNYLYQGVTTLVTGNCGYGYTDTDKWLDMVDSVGFGSNIYHLIPHGELRWELFGANQPKILGPKQLEELKARVVEEMAKGAVGLSTGLEYMPGALTEPGEIIELAKAVRKNGGIYTTHIRDESGRINAQGEAGVLSAIKEAIDVGRRAEISLEISHLKISVPINETKPEELIALIEQARHEGIDLHADQYPYAAGSTFLAYPLPDKYKTTDAVKSDYKTKAGRQELKAAAEAIFAYMGPDKILITYHPEDESCEGLSLAELADRQKISAADIFVDLVCGDEVPLAVFFGQDMEVVKALAPHDFMITASDGWTNPKDMMKPHPRVYGTFPRKIRRFVLDQNIMGLTAAIRSMTSLPAEKFNIKDRGRLAEGCFADVVVIDKDSVRDRATYKDPHQYSEGIKHVLVNGVVALSRGEATGDRGGRALRRA